MQLTLVTATGRREQLELAQDQLTATALHAAVACRLGLPPLKQAYLRLVCAGQALSDDEAVSKLKDGGAWGTAGGGRAVLSGRAGRAVTQAGHSLAISR